MIDSLHYMAVCEYGIVHEQCRCPGPKETLQIKCNTIHHQSSDYEDAPHISPEIDEQRSFPQA